MPNKIAVTHPKTGRTITVPPEQLPGLKAAGWTDEPVEISEPARDVDQVEATPEKAATAGSGRRRPSSTTTTVNESQED